MQHTFKESIAFVYTRNKLGSIIHNGKETKKCQINNSIKMHSIIDKLHRCVIQQSHYRL